MKSLITLSSKYLIILPATFFVSLISLIVMLIATGSWDTMALNHIDVHVSDVQPTCVKVSLLNQKNNDFEVNIACPELLQDANRQSMEEEIRWDLYNATYPLEYRDRDWEFPGSQILSTFIPYFSANWSIEKTINNTRIVLTGITQGDVVFIITNILYCAVALSFLLSVVVLLIFFFLKFLHMLHNQKSI